MHYLVWAPWLFWALFRLWPVRLARVRQVALVHVATIAVVMVAVAMMPGALVTRVVPVLAHLPA